MILPIVAYGDPILRKECDDIEEGDDLTDLLANMFETMYESSGVGLAAPQINKNIRLFIVDAAPFAEDDPDDEEEAKELAELATFKRVFINPIMESETGEEWGFKEGCLSIPGIRGGISPRKNCD